VAWNSERDTGSQRGRRVARGARRLGPSSATYPNCSAVGRPGGGTVLGQTLGTAQGQTAGQGAPSQGTSTPWGGAWGRGRGGGLLQNMGGTTSGRGGASGSRDHHQGGEGREWTTVGRWGSSRPRDMSRSPQEGRGPPGKRVNSMTSPGTANTRVPPSSSSTSARTSS
jgi:hypothetical protein